MSLKPQALQSVNQTVYQQFPELRGARPSVQSQQSPAAKGSGDAESRHVLTYKGHVEGPGGHRIARVVRVVANASGKILKISTSK